MAVVVDASALGAILCGEPDGPTVAAHLEGETLLAPTLLDYELANLVLKKIRRRPEQAERLQLSLAAALRVPIDRVRVPGLPVLALAQALGLTAYDASYLWLARSRDAELVTLDKTLSKFCEG